MSARRKTEDSFPISLSRVILNWDCFYFSLNSLADPLSKEEETNTEAISHEEFIDRIAPYAQELQKAMGFYQVSL